MTGAKPVGKAGRKRKTGNAKGVKVYTELRLKDYAKLRKYAYKRQLKMAAVVREFVLLGLEASASKGKMAQDGAIDL